MFFYLSKILQFLITPLNWVFILLIIGFFSRNVKKKKRLNWLSIIVFIVFSNSFIVDEVYLLYEERNIKYSEISQVFDVAIVLGGFVSNNHQLELENFHSSTDRLMHGLKLYKTGKTKKLMIVSGSGKILDQQEKEAIVVKDYLLSIGFPEEDLIIESESKNTRENAVNTAEILNKEYSDGDFILITSAAHMPRAKRCFEKVGLKVTPFSVDHSVVERSFYPEHLIVPNSYAMVRWKRLIHEWVGLVSYKIMGYI